MEQGWVFKNVWVTQGTISLNISISAACIFYYLFFKTASSWILQLWGSEIYKCSRSRLTKWCSGTLLPDIVLTILTTSSVLAATVLPPENSLQLNLLWSLTLYNACSDLFYFIPDNPWSYLNASRLKQQIPPTSSKHPSNSELFFFFSSSGQRGDSAGGPDNQEDGDSRREAHRTLQTCRGDFFSYYSTTLNYDTFPPQYQTHWLNLTFLNW